MKISKNELRRLIAEELQSTLQEQTPLTRFEDYSAMAPLYGAANVLDAPTGPVRGLATTPKPVMAADVFRGKTGDPFEYADMGDGSYMFRDTRDPDSKFQFAKGSAVAAIDQLRQTPIDVPETRDFAGVQPAATPAATTAPEMTKAAQKFAPSADLSRRQFKKAARSARRELGGRANLGRAGRQQVRDIYGLPTGGPRRIRQVTPDDIQSAASARGINEGINIDALVDAVIAELSK
jgi:hypothetical protein